MTESLFVPETTFLWAKMVPLGSFALIVLQYLFLELLSVTAERHREGSKPIQQ